MNLVFVPIFFSEIKIYLNCVPILTISSFYRKGKVNGYRDEMSADQIQRFDKWERNHDK